MCALSRIQSGLGHVISCDERPGLRVSPWYPQLRASANFRLLRGSQPLRRFFKSAAFPILLVVILAFIAQRLISPGPNEEQPSYSDFLTQIERGQVEEVTIKTKDNTLEWKQNDEDEYSTGYPPNTEESLLNRL